LFASIGPLCQNSVAPALPLASTNGITGTWSPATINTTAVGTTTYTFTPDAAQCAITATLDIEISNQILPLFASIGPLCQNSVAPALPLASSNGITGTWSPATISTSAVGTTTYTFTPDAAQCSVATPFTIEIIAPVITQIQAITSTNGLPNGHATIIAESSTSALTYSLNGTDWQNSNEFTGLLAGTYTAWVMNANGCQASQSFIIANTVTGEVGVLAGDVKSCIGIPFEIPLMAYDFTNISSFTVQLTFDSTALTFSSLSQVNKFLKQGNLTATLLSPGILQIGFIATDSITLLSEDLLFDLNFIGISAGSSQLQWNWLKCVIYSASGYEIPAIYTMGAVTVRPAPQVYTVGSGTYCENSTITLNAGSLTGQNLSYNWISPNGTTHKGMKWDLGVVNMTASGEYHLIASDSTACANDETVMVQINPKPVVNLAEYDSLCIEQVVQLDAGSGFADYLWQDGSKAPQMDTIAEGLYWVNVVDFNGCQGSDSVRLVSCEMARSTELKIWLPNAFSPNGDGINDVFGAKYNFEVKIDFQMLVFNIWGEQIFSSNDINKGWDGKYKGESCPMGMYTYLVTFKAGKSYTFDQNSPLRGNVTILK
jgi:gliding motility-associated-like protein